MAYTRTLQLSILLLILAAFFYRPQSDLTDLADMLIIAAGSVFAFALWQRRKTVYFAPLPDITVQVAPSNRIRWLPLVVGVICLALLAYRNGQYIALVNLHVQMLLLILGVASVVIGASGFRRADIARFGRLWRSHRSEIILVAVITFGALLLRLWRVESSIFSFIDEGPFITAVVTMRGEPGGTLLTPMQEVASFTRVYAYLQWVFSDVFGSSLATIRAVSAIFGTLSVAAMYVLVRWTFSRRAALLSTLLLATFPPHLHMSRIGLNNIADPLFGVLALAFLIRALQTKNRAYYVLTGAMVGLLPYFYEGGELLYPALVVIWLIWIALTGWLPISWRGLLWMVCTAAVLAAPVYYTILVDESPLLSRLASRNLGSIYWQEVFLKGGLPELQHFFRTQLMPPLLHYVHAPDGSTFYGGNTALVLPYFVPLFWLGIFHAFRRLNGVGMLLILWVLLTALGNSLIFFNAWTARFVVVMPAIVILVATGITETLQLLMPSQSRRNVQVAGSLITLMTVVHIGYYFGSHLDTYDSQIQDLNCHHDAMYRIVELPEDREIYFSYQDHVQIQFTQPYLDYIGDGAQMTVGFQEEITPRLIERDEDIIYVVREDDIWTTKQLSLYWKLDEPLRTISGATCEREYVIYYLDKADRIK